MLIVLSVLGLVAGYFIFRITSNFIAKATIFNPGGAPLPSNETADPAFTPEPGMTPTAPPLDTFTMPEAWDGKTRVNLLVMGIDARSPDAANPLTDTMILFTLDPVNNTAGMLSIPRDLWVKIPGSDYNKINTAYSIGERFQLPGGGPALAAKTVENLLGVPVHFYAQVDFKAFVKFIDLIDGVKLTTTESVQLNIVDTTFSQWLEPGTYTLTGELALAYVRYREPNGGDIARSQRQQQVIMAIRDRILHFNMLPKLIQRAPELYESLSQGIRTNLTLEQVIQLAIKVLNDIPREQIAHTAITFQDATPGTSPDGLAILRPIPDRIRAVRDSVFGGGGAIDVQDPATMLNVLAEEGATVSIMNGSSTGGLAERTTEYLKSQGVNVVEQGNAAYSTYTTITFYGAKPYTLNYLVKFLGVTEPYRITYAYDPNAPIHISVVLGDDFAANNTLP
ncbi:MAG: LCP family protein [Anaerolineaceae bacterium]|nr:LCP family protein [Anaerolineaceae bacterium]MDI9531510.1 LCP family protein [Chloroflexota bacterium]NLE92833.1 LCP family protein [Chloroflexota bacterium]HOF27967.1 LCP family protein [Anaerolineaceae bacterium]